MINETTEVQKLISWTNEQLLRKNKIMQNSSLEEASWHFFDTQTYFEIKAMFTLPESLQRTQRHLWDTITVEIGSKSNFSKRTLFEKDPYFIDSFVINFKEPKEELYLLTPTKESILNQGFDKVNEYRAWYDNLVNGFNSLMKESESKIREFFERSRIQYS